MIREIAHIHIQDGTGDAFEAAVRQSLPLFHRARGCTGVSLHRVIEQPGHYRLVVQWATLEDHMTHFRNSEDFQAWRGLVGHFFAATPQVVHVEEAVS